MRGIGELQDELSRLRRERFPDPPKEILIGSRDLWEQLRPNGEYGQLIEERDGVRIFLGVPVVLRKQGAADFDFEIVFEDQD